MVFLNTRPSYDEFIAARHKALAPSFANIKDEGREIEISVVSGLPQEKGIIPMVTGVNFDERLGRLEAKHGLRQPTRVESLSIPAGKKPEVVAQASEDLLVNSMLGMAQDSGYVPPERVLTEVEQAEDNLVNGMLKMSEKGGN